MHYIKNHSLYRHIFLIPIFLAITGCSPIDSFQDQDEPHITTVSYDECPEYTKTEKTWYAKDDNSIRTSSEESLYGCPLKEDESFGSIIIQEGQYTEEPKYFITDKCFAVFTDKSTNKKYYQLARISDNGVTTRIAVPQHIYEQLIK